MKAAVSARGQVQVDAMSSDMGYVERARETWVG